MDVTHYILGYLNPYGEWWYLMQYDAETYNGKYMVCRTTQNPEFAMRIGHPDAANEATARFWGYWQVIAEPVHEIISFK